jgi:hypothetical protein
MSTRAAIGVLFAGAVLSAIILAHGCTKPAPPEQPVATHAQCPQGEQLILKQQEARATFNVEYRKCDTAHDVPACKEQATTQYDDALEALCL